MAGLLKASLGAARRPPGESSSEDAANGCAEFRMPDEDESLLVLAAVLLRSWPPPLIGVVVEPGALPQLLPSVPLRTAFFGPWLEGTVAPEVLEASVEPAAQEELWSRTAADLTCSRVTFMLSSHKCLSLSMSSWAHAGSSASRGLKGASCPGCCSRAVQPLTSCLLWPWNAATVAAVSTLPLRRAAAAEAAVSLSPAPVPRTSPNTLAQLMRRTVLLTPSS
mmetsp:Transcript_72581/g.200207  ORF Transcript_72581/g.200207 Transcript_72581/m.200207 type:complete len:222 (+) Transcript_72581:497-1162(+)